MSGLWSFRCDGIAGDCRRAEVEHALDVEGQLCEQLRGEALGVDARARRHHEGRARTAGHAAGAAAAAAAAADEEDEGVDELISRLRQTFRGAGDDDEAEVEEDDADLGFAELRKLFPDDVEDDAAAAAAAAPTVAASDSYDGVGAAAAATAAADDGDGSAYGSESEYGGGTAAPLEDEDAFHELRSLLRGGGSPLRSPVEARRRAGASGDLDSVMESLAATAAAAGAATPRRRGAPLSLEDGALPMPHCEQRLYDPREYPALFEVQMLAESGARRPAPAVLPPEYDISTLDLRGAARPLPLPPTSPAAAAVVAAPAGTTPQARRRAKPRPLPEAPLRTPPPPSPATPSRGTAARAGAEARATPARQQKRKVMWKKMAPAAAAAPAPRSSPAPSPAAGVAGDAYGAAALADVAATPPVSASPTTERRARDLETLLACELLSIPASSRSPEERASPQRAAVEEEERTSAEASKTAAFVEELVEEERPDATGEGTGDATLPVAFTGFAAPVLDVWSEEGYAAVEAAVEAEASLCLPEAVVASPPAASPAAPEPEETCAAAAEEAGLREAEEKWTPPPPPPPPPEAFAAAAAPVPTPVHASPDAAPRWQAWAAAVPSPPSPHPPAEDGFADTRISPPPRPSPSSSSEAPPQPQTQSPEPYRAPESRTLATAVAPVAAPATEQPCCLADVPPSPLFPAAAAAAAAAAEPRPTALQRAMSKRGSPFLAPAADPQARQPPPPPPQQQPPPQAHATRIDRVVSALRARAETAQQAGAALTRRPVVAAAAEQPSQPPLPSSVALADLPRRRANSGSAATLPPLEPRPSAAAASTAAAVAAAKSNIAERRLHRQAARDALQQRYAAIQEQKAAEMRRLAELRAAEEALEQARAQEARRAKRAEERRKAAERATRRGARLERWDAAVAYHNRTLLRAYGLRPLARNVEAARARVRAAVEADRVRLQRVALRGWTAAQAQWERVRQVVHVLRCVQLSRVLRACFLRGMLRRWRGVGRARALQETHAAAVGRRRAQEGAWAVWRAAYVRRVTLVRHRQESLADKLRGRLDGQRTLRCLRVWRARAEERQAAARRAQFRQRMMGAVQDILSEPVTLRHR